MGEILPPKPVLPIVAATSQFPEALDWARTRLSDRFQTEIFASPAFAFHQTDYYETSMGADLKKQFFVPELLVDPGILAEWKVETNHWEDEFKTTRIWAAERPLNLDPGYISQDKLVLASTKNHAHRIYLSAGIYAEMTLQFRAKKWQPWPWTYPDYKEPEFLAFFDECRQKLRLLLRQQDP